LYFVYFLQYSDTVGWVFWPVKTVGRITYIVLAQTLNHAQPQRNTLISRLYLVIIVNCLDLLIYDELLLFVGWRQTAANNEAKQSDDVEWWSWLRLW